MVDRGEEFADVAFEYPAGAGVVARDLVGELAETDHCLVCPLTSATRVRIGNECAVEEWIELAVERVVEQPIAHGRFVDVAGLGVADAEVLVSAMLVCARSKVAIECEDVVHQLVLELLHVLLLPLAPYELTPRGKQILHRDDIFIGMSELNSPRGTPPPKAFFPFFWGSNRVFFLCVGHIFPPP